LDIGTVATVTVMLNVILLCDITVQLFIYNVLFSKVQFLTFWCNFVLPVIFGQPFVKQSPYAIGLLSCLSVLSVTLVYCGQTAGQIKMKLGMQAGLGQILLDGDTASPKNIVMQS